MVVPVLMTNCHVSLKPNSGPVSPQTTTIATASPKADALPRSRADALAHREKRPTPPMVPQSEFISDLLPLLCHGLPPTGMYAAVNFLQIDSTLIEPHLIFFVGILRKSPS